jgi:hypothetical protein
MPFGIRIHSGTLNVVACDIDGWPNPAVHGVGDTGPTIVNIVDSTVGASRYDTSGNRVAEGAAAIQSSKPSNTARDRVTMTLTRVQIDPAVQAAMGQSIRVGSTVLDQFTQTDTTFVGQAGTPSVQVFEDFPSITATGIPSPEAFGTASISRRNIVAAASLASDETFGASNVTHALRIAAIGLPSDEGFGDTAVSLAGIIGALGIPSDEAFGASQTQRSNTLATASVASSEAFGVARITRLLRAVSIASDEAFGASTARLSHLVQAFGVPTSEAFGVAAMATSGLIAAASIPSAEAFGVALITVGEPAADTAPQLVEPGRLAPSGDAVLTGTRVTATIGHWTGYPHESRVVWLRDDTPILDTGYRTEVWSDTYTLTQADVGHVITAQQQVRNPVGESQPSIAAGQVRALLRSIPPAFVDHTAVFGPMIALSDVWTALRTTIETWLPTFLRERERLSQRAYGALQGPRGWRIYTDTLDALTGDQFPLCVIVAPGLPDAPQPNGDGTYRGTLEMGVSIIVQGRDVTETIDNAAQYGAALRSLLTKHGSLGGISSGTSIIGERYDELPSEDQRTVCAAEIVISVRVDGINRLYGGPAVPAAEPPPQPDPGAPTLGTVATTVLELERV